MTSISPKHNEYDEAKRVANICNACRYCEDFCDVFPSMERLIKFDKGEVNFLANLCHDCRECYHACQFAPPHEYAVNFPQVMSKVRVSSYKPDSSKIGRLISIITGKFCAIYIYPLLFILFGILKYQENFWVSYSIASGNFYQLISHQDMLSLFGTLGLLIATLVIIRTSSFYHSINKDDDSSSLDNIYQAFTDAFTLKNLKSSGSGCSYPKSQQSKARTIFHHLMASGFIFSFAATITGTLYHYILILPAPYALVSLPVILGSIGGIFLIIGCFGLIILKSIQDKAPTDPQHDQSSVKFLLLLLMIAASGMLLLILRETIFMGVFLYWHLGLVFSFFLAFPYEKMMHIFFRIVALIKAKSLITNE
jgi:citrate/tricarballylate utilization protein